MTQKQTCPEGFMPNARGGFDPIHNVKPIDLERDELVKNLCSNAKELAGIIADYRIHALNEIQGFVEKSAKHYRTKLGGEKGNITLLSYDGSIKIVRSQAEHILFDERLQAAKALIDACIREWTEGANANLVAVINQAFTVDKDGRYSVGRLLSLNRLNIDDQRWIRAMKAMKDSMQAVGSKTYLRIYERQSDGSYKPLSLDIASA